MSQRVSCETFLEFKFRLKKIYLFSVLFTHQFICECKSFISFLFLLLWRNKSWISSCVRFDPTHTLHLDMFSCFYCFYFESQTHIHDKLRSRWRLCRACVIALSFYEHVYVQTARMTDKNYHRLCVECAVNGVKQLHWRWFIMIIISERIQMESGRRVPADHRTLKRHHFSCSLSPLLATDFRDVHTRSTIFSFSSPWRDSLLLLLYWTNYFLLSELCK